jgi:hypothetical protein|tara:strand:- start:5891 stop:6208 length:318 start_codon:yes stop_codon:yes gene_type:complete
MGRKIKLTERQLENVVNEAIGFTIPSYPNQTIEELDALINVMTGPITNLRKNKTFPDDEPVVQRIYQLVAEGGELHVKVQELIDLLESLDDRQKQQLGFRTSSYN